jgi:hypothetical protein
MFFLYNFLIIVRYILDKLGTGTFMRLQILSSSVCPKCNKHFTCEVVAGSKSCWCMSFIKVSAFSRKGWQDKGCLCPSCLAIMATPAKNNESV